MRSWTIGLVKFNSWNLRRKKKKERKWGEGRRGNEEEDKDISGSIV